jgi:stage III sporulation protein AF
MLLEWVKSGLIFGVFASVILMLAPNKSYMKHISFVVGLLFVLVMLHPITVFLEMDEDTYLSYIQNLLKVEESETAFTQNDIKLYESSLEAQLKAVFLEKGYEVKNVEVQTDSEGNVQEVVLSMGGETAELENVEKYLHKLLGEDVRIVYE